jgi:hypothetical protein
MVVSAEGEGFDIVPPCGEPMVAHLLNRAEGEGFDIVPPAGNPWWLIC